MLEETVLGMMRRIYSLFKRSSTSISKEQLSPAFLISTSVEFAASLEKRVNTVRRKKGSGAFATSVPRLATCHDWVPPRFAHPIADGYGPPPQDHSRHFRVQLISHTAVFKSPAVRRTSQLHVLATPVCAPPRA